MASDRGLCCLGFAAETGEQATFDDLAARWPRAALIQDDAAVAPHLAAAFGGGEVGGGEVGGGDMALHLIGAPFQIKVWEALLTIPPGTATSYGALAARLGTPRAARAVGAAVGRNPLSWLIPCHRVLAANGALTGYHWGLPVKRAMLAWESARADA
jgi:AraC family transcriptional regulator, regulatory protein of adaptative response / methylated-DNA-[protein]-cysteine methyltransferase